MEKQQKFVVVIEGTDMYLTGYNVGTPANSIFGNLNDCIEYDTQADADDIASKIGSGPIGVPRPH